MNQDIQLLKDLCETPGIAGNEERVSEFIQGKLNSMGVEYTEDAMGNIIARKPGSGEKVQLLCHMDEIGFIVNYISDDGFAYVQPLGGFDARNLFSRRVLVCTDNGDYKGVMNPAGLPVHLAKPEERTKVPAPDEFIIDIGFGKETKEHIQVGDFVVMDEPFLQLSDTRVVSKALDNRVACWLGLKALEQARTDKDLYVVFTVQEEVGLRGAKTASFGIQPDVTIGLDITLACDTPGVPANKTTSKLGEGFCLGIRDASMIGHKGLVREFTALAKNNMIPMQRLCSAGGGQDAAAGQQTAAGSKAINLAVGTRYVHTVTEMIHTDDLYATLDILLIYLNEQRQ